MVYYQKNKYRQRNSAPKNLFAMTTTNDYPYTVMPENRCYGKITQHGVVDRMIDIKNALNEEYLERFKHSCFGNFLALTKLKFFGTIVHQMILHLVETKKNNELWFKFDGNLTRFGLEEFVLVTGLTTGAPQFGRAYEKVVKNQQFYTRCFGNRSEVKFKDLEDALFSTENIADKYRVALLYCLEGIVDPSDRNNCIRKEFIALTQDEELFNSYLWGTRVYELLVQSVKSKHWNLRFRGTCDDQGGKGMDTYQIYGFPMALQIWAYESIPQLAQEYSTKASNNYPRMVRWRGKKYIRSEVLDMYLKLNRLRTFATLQPDETEKQKDYYAEMVKSTDDESDEFLDELAGHAISIQLPHEENKSSDNDNRKNVHVSSGAGPSRSSSKRTRDESTILEAIGALAKKMVKMESLCRKGFRKMNIEIDDLSSDESAQKRGRNYTDDRTFDELLNYNNGTTSSQPRNGPDEEEDVYEDGPNENDDETGTNPDRNAATGEENNDGDEPGKESEEHGDSGDESEEASEEQETDAVKDGNSKAVNFPEDFLFAVDGKREREYSRSRRRNDDSYLFAVGPHSVSFKMVKEIDRGKKEWTTSDMNLALWTLRNGDERARELFRPAIGVMDCEFTDALIKSWRPSQSTRGRGKQFDARIPKFVDGSMYPEGRPIIEMDSLVFPVYVKEKIWVLIHADLVSWRAHALDCHTSSVADGELSAICVPYMKTIAQIVDYFDLREKRPDYSLGIQSMPPDNN